MHFLVMNHCSCDVIVYLCTEVQLTKAWLLDIKLSTCLQRYLCQATVTS